MFDLGRNSGAPMTCRYIYEPRPGVFRSNVTGDSRIVTDDSGPFAKGHPIARDRFVRGDARRR